MTDFEKFMTGLANDERLGRLFPGASSEQSAEVVVLSLALQLADALEGKPEHPAVGLLRRMEAAR